MDLPVFRDPNNIPIDFQEACVDGDLEKASNILVDRQDFSILDAVEALPVELLDKAMLKAARSGKVGLAEKLLNMGARVDPLDRNGATPLHIACAYGPLELVQILLKHNADVNKKDKSNYTPLHNTLRNKAILSIVEILLENGADMAAKNSYGHTPLNQACCFGELEIVQTLLRHHADINAKGRGDITPLVEACMFGHLKIVKELLKHNPNIHAIYKGVGRQYTPLDMAAVYGFSEIVEELLKHGADINFGSCLHLAISNDHHEVVKTLLKYGSILRLSIQHFLTVLLLNWHCIIHLLTL